MRSKMHRLLLDALIIALPGGGLYALYKGTRYAWQRVRRWQNAKRVQRLTYEAIIDNANMRYTDEDWRRLYRAAMAEPETVYDDVPELGWKAKAITQRKWGQS